MARYDVRRSNHDLSNWCCLIFGFIFVVFYIALLVLSYIDSEQQDVDSQPVAEQTA